MGESASAARWTLYFDDQSDGAPTRALREQLEEAEEDIFDDSSSSFTVSDIVDGKSTTWPVQNEADFDAIPDPAKTKHRTRIISISSPRTIKPLRITPRLASRVLLRHRVKPDFLRVLLSFGEDPHVSEASSGFYTFHAPTDGSYTACYKLNYVERNRRSERDPWSFRHVGVYHQRDEHGHLFLLVYGTPNTNLFESMATLIPGGHDVELSQIAVELLQDNPASLHSHIFSCYIDNWRPYLRHLGARFNRINQAMIVDAEKSGEESFSRVQSLRNTNDFAMFANACCASNRNIVDALKTDAVLSRNGAQGFTNTLTGYVESCQILQQRIQNATDLVGYTLSLHNQLETAKMDREIRDMTEQMKNLAQETGVVTKKLQELTQNTVDDSAVVSIITIASAIYLPGSFVGSIFGMNFFVFDTQARTIVIGNDFWIFIVLWIGLTLLTGAAFGVTYWAKRKRIPLPWSRKRDLSPASEKV